MAPTFRGNNGGAHNWLPSAPFDIIGVDGYNRWPCYRKNGNKSFNDIFAAAHSFAVARGKPMAICEYGTLEGTACGNSGGNPSAKAEWFDNAASRMKTWGNVVFASYSHVFATYRGKPLGFWFNTSARSLNAFADIGASSYFR